MQKKRKRDKADEGPRHSPTTAMRDGQHDKESGTELKSEVSRMSSIFKMTLTQQTFQTNVPVEFEDENVMMIHLKKVFEKSNRIFFHACYDSPVDPLTSDKDLINMTAHKIWRVTGYRFR